MSIDQLSDEEKTFHSEYEILEEEKPDHFFRTEIPNIVFELPLDPYEFRVYAHLKKIAGDRGKCWKNVKNMALEIGISKRKFQYCLQKLSSKFKLLNDNSLIKIIRRKKDDGSYCSNLIYITSIWKINGDHSRNKEFSSGAYNAEGGRALKTVPSEQYAVKEDPIEEDPRKEEYPIQPPPHTPPPKPSPHKKRPDESGGGGEIKIPSEENFEGETLEYTNGEGSRVTIRASEIYRRLVGTGVPSGIISKALKIASKNKNKIGDIYRYVEGTCAKLIRDNKFIPKIVEKNEVEQKLYRWGEKHPIDKKDLKKDGT